MVLVVNKMSRESGTPEELLKTILKVIEPYHPNDFYTCFIDADSYLKAQEPRLRKYQESLLSKANFNKLLDSIQKLIEKNKLLETKLLTPLRSADAMLEQARNLLSTGDKSTRDLLEILRRKSLILISSQTRSRNAYHAELNKLEHEIIMLGEKAASKVDGYHSEEEIKTEIEKAEKEIESISETALQDIHSALQSELIRLQAKLEELQKSPLGRSLVEEFEIRLVDGKPLNNSYKLGERPFAGKGAELLKGVSGFASKVSRDLVYSIGKSIGIKFKPYGAVNAAKFLRGLGPFLVVGGVVLDTVMTDKQEQDEAEYQQKLRQARMEMRQEFRNVASEMRKEYEGNIKEAISRFYDEELKDIECKQKDLSNIEQSKVNIVNQIDNKRQEIKEEIQRLIE